ncbi:hypothetical protein SBOR_8208 [Sclerotinia borealis F-4128]|uniref:Geranylgeranyl pyrophosphate synthetase n=1 Tax=Sclerotinia borealis (strain F-4128) TaxID=1432307 RepID=W9C951_SCLBF|nr:hypothetical protein SBOR_8208 [Sclerotinia borealis F-4128]
MDIKAGNDSAMASIKPNTSKKLGELFRNTGETIASIRVSSLVTDSTNERVTITEYKHVTSFNFLNTIPLTIMVPGSPPIWSPPAMPVNIQPDVINSKMVRKAERQAQRSSIAPVFAALSVNIADTSFLPSTDLITDRNSLRKLLAFVNGRVEQIWKIDVELVRNTMVITQNTEGIPRHHPGGYGVSFEKAFLKYSDEFKRSREHNRVAVYKIGGMNWMVGFEVDGCYGVQGREGLSQKLQTLNLNPTIDVQSSDGLQKSPDTLNLNPKTQTTYPGIRIIKTGTEISTLPLLEVKTAKMGRSPPRAKLMPQLYFSQTKHLIVANYDGGTFDEAHITETDKTEDMREWEEENQEKLQKLLHLISSIRDIVNGTEGKKAVLLCERGKKNLIRVLEQKGKGLQLEEKFVTQLWGPPIIG